MIKLINVQILGFFPLFPKSQIVKLSFLFVPKFSTLIRIGFNMHIKFSIMKVAQLIIISYKSLEQQNWRYSSLIIPIEIIYELLSFNNSLKYLFLILVYKKLILHTNLVSINLTFNDLNYNKHLLVFYQIISSQKKSRSKVLYLKSNTFLKLTITIV